MKQRLNQITLARQLSRFFNLVLLAAFMVTVTGLPALLLTEAAEAANLRLKDISRIKSVRYNQVVGYGLVVGFK